MHKVVLQFALLVLFVTACAQKPNVPATPTATTPALPFTQVAPPTNTSAPLTPQNIPPATALPAAGSLVVITAGNVSELDKVMVLTGHTNRVTDLVFSPEGAYLASTGYDEKIRLWDLNTWQEAYTFSIDEADLNVLAFSPDGALLASGQAVWNVATKETIHTLEERLVEPSHVAFSPDGSQLAVVSSAKVKVWDVASWKEVLAIDFPAGCLWLFGITYSPDGKWIAAGSGANGTVYIWSAETGQLARTFEQGNEHDVHDIAFTPDGQWLASGGTDYFARIWNVSTGEAIRKMPLIGMYSLAISPDGMLLAAAGPDRAVTLWDVRSGTMLRSLHHADELMAVTFSSDGRLIAAGGYDNTITVWGITP